MTITANTELSTKTPQIPQPTEDEIAAVLYSGPARFAREGQKGGTIRSATELEYLDKNNEVKRIFTCVTCGWTTDHYYGVFGHQSRHSDVPRRRKGTAVKADKAKAALPATIAELIEAEITRRVNEQLSALKADATLNKLKEERDAARAEARETRKALNAIKNALK